MGSGPVKTLGKQFQRRLEAVVSSGPVSALPTPPSPLRLGQKQGRSPPLELILANNIGMHSLSVRLPRNTSR